MPAACDKKEYGLYREKRRCEFSSVGLSLRFRLRSIPSRTYKYVIGVEPLFHFLSLVISPGNNYLIFAFADISEDL